MVLILEMNFNYSFYCFRKKSCHENIIEFKDKIKGVIGSDEFMYQNLLYMEYESNVFSISEDYGLDYVKFNQKISKVFYWSINKEEFKSLITNNKIDLVNDFNYTDLYNNHDSVWDLIMHSIKLDNSEFVNLLLQKSGIKLGNDSLFYFDWLYREVKIILR